MLPAAPRCADQSTDLLLEAASLLTSCSNRTGSMMQVDSGTLTIAGDLHDNLAHLAKVAVHGGLDQGGHVVVQELIHGPVLHHGCDLSHRMLLRIAALVKAFPGLVHPLLGNHELAQLLKRGVSKGGGNSVVQFDDGLDLAFGDEAQKVSDAIDTFIRAMPLAVRTPGGILIAHSMPQAQHMARFDTAVLDRAVTEDDLAGPFGSAYLLTWGRNYSDETLSELAAAWDVQGFILGHMHAEMGAEARGTRAVILNSDHERGVLLQIEADTAFNATKFAMDAVPLQLISLPDGVL
ncbi:MAG: metallophosphoesterase [Phycisphaerales bacterium]|nr:metallophosphoesterase [Phycisphaerales bacterium]